VSTSVLGEPDPRSLNLPSTSPATELLYELDELSGTGRSNWMAAGPVP